MVSNRRDDDTQIRIIRSVVQDEMRDERSFYLDSMRRIGEDIKSEMHRHFATATDLANWKLDLIQHTNQYTGKAIKEHSSRYHKPISLAPRAAWSKKTIGIFSGIGAAIGGVVYTLVRLFS